VPFTINDKQQSGDIINIHLRRVFSGNADWIAYSASKFAVLGLTIPLCKMRKHNVRVTALTPNAIATDMAKILN
jgi:NAD(P)-dependent dehydrogenase (short-subunit alcohol dehydrogenase family)